MRNILLYGFLLAVVIGFTSCSDRKSEDPEPRVYYPLSRFCMGADLSFVNQLMDNGAVFRDSGKVKDPFLIFKQYGCNLVRVRLWHTPLWTMGNGTKMYSDLADVEKTIRRAKEAGMAVSLDFHYSDNWADPGKQEPPAAWRNADFAGILDSVYNYTFKVLKYLGGKNLMPEMVQIGNEINPGMLFPHGKIETSGWENLGLIINKGIKAVRDASVNTTVKPEVILHAAQPENIEWWFTNIVSKGKVTDFDIIGLSYYIKWSEVPLSSIGGYILRFKTLFNKKVMIVETAYSWTSEGADNYGNIFSSSDYDPAYPQTEQGQLDYLKALTQQVINGKGDGIQYWEPAWISTSMKDQWGTGSPWENNAFFDFDGNTIRGINFMTGSYKGLDEE